jgi:hypothetical protein
MVSTVKKSTAIRLFAWARMNSRHEGPRRRPAGPSCSARRTFLTVERTRGDSMSAAFRLSTSVEIQPAIGDVAAPRGIWRKPPQ